MKKIFTSISLAAMSFVAMTPAVAQQQTLSDAQKTAIVETLVPAMLDQVKQVSGIDFISLANPNIETLLASPLFGTKSTLRASNPISVKMDSTLVDLSSMSGIPSTIAPLLKNLKIVMADYETFNVMAGERTVQISMPKTIKATAIGMDAMTLSFKIEKNSEILPISAISGDLAINPMIESMMAGKLPIKSGSLFSLKETKQSTGVYKYNVKVGESLSSILSMIPALTPIMPALPTDYTITTDMSKVASTATITASVVGNYTTPATATRPLGDASVYLNPQALAKGIQKADSTILTSYEMGTVNVKGYKKMVSEYKNSATYAYTYEKATKDAEWQAPAIMKTSMKGNTIDIDPSNIAGSVVKNIMADLMSNPVKEPLMSFTTTIASVHNTTAVETPKVIIEVSTAMKAVEETKATTATKYQPVVTITITNKAEVTPAEEGAETTTGDKVNVLTINIPTESNSYELSYEINANGMVIPTKSYIYSDAMGVITGNDQITAESPAQILVNENGIRVNNVEKATYSITGMNGTSVANGTISGEGAYIATPSLMKGQIYIITIVENNGAVKSVKFQK